MKQKDELEMIYKRLDELASMYRELSDKREQGIQITEEDTKKLSKLADSLGYYAFTYRKMMEGKRKLKTNTTNQVDPSKQMVDSNGWVIDSIPLELLDIPLVDKDAILGKEIEIYDIITHPSDYQPNQNFYPIAFAKYIEQKKNNEQHNEQKFSVILTPTMYRQIREINALPIIVVTNKRTSQASGRTYYFIEKHMLLPDSHPANLPELPQPKEEQEPKQE